MLDAVRALPDHLRDALWRIESASTSTMEAPAAFVCGMGGSAIGGDLAGAALADRLTKPTMVIRSYELPSWAPAGSAVLCSSYSGDTEETLACYAAAEALGAQRLVATTGGELAEAARGDGVPVIGLPAGLQPRAAIGYTFCCAAELIALALAGPRINTEIDAAASHLGQAFEAVEARARKIAAEIGDATPVIYGSDVTAPVAYRWKTQVNENAKMPAFSATLPEADHNEIEGWSGADGGFARDLPAGPRPASARAKALRADGQGDRALRGGGDRGRDGGRDAHRARPARGDAGRPGRNRAGERARGRSAGCRLARGFQEGDGPAATGPSSAAPRA